MMVSPIAPSSLLTLPAICPNGMPYQEVNGIIPHCSIAKPCPLNYFCHVGADISTTACCKVTCKH